MSEIHGLRFHNYKVGRFEKYQVMQYVSDGTWVNIDEPVKLEMSPFEKFMSLVNKDYMK